MAMAAIDIRPWRGNRTDIPLRGRALVLPGSGYTVDHPVLFWTCQVLGSAGWQVTAVDWHVDDSVAQDPRPFVESAAHRLDQGAEPAERTLVVGKSLGSYACSLGFGARLPRSVAHPGVDGRCRRRGPYDIRPACPPGPRHGGSAWVSNLAHASGKDVLELEGADHSLHIGNDWRASLRALESCLAAVEGFASRLE